ncbi:NEDD8-activating enzyme E1 regulatory subunit AXR1 isoform X2 [Hevea brasiliensis]|uniref:NEDD8-activating enzyme E1 regulatory subunit AXR1 isoform X2 n=1 Tax=Hevea brasiliensis TaxID=3981 RepID=UPI0025EFD5FA|nr:NEDD8-activating enzyme E1 regulatory subunit AXR1 isoform X2 [Hevea brasiliensis]
MAEPKTKYDRQLRIWGEQGQAALEKASICLLNCGPTGSETLKNLVLGGVGSITVIDGSKVEVSDLGNNFMVDESSVGQSKAKCVCAFLQELNDAVKAKFIEEHPEALIETNPSFFSQFTLVVATQLVEDSMVKLDKICREANVKLIFARSYGLTGFVRVSVKEHTVIESKPDHFLDDLRLNNPWPELKSFAETIDLNVADPVAHKHTPYVIILVKMAEEWAKTHGGSLPSTRDEKKQFKELLKAGMVATDEENYKEAIEASFKVFAPRGISLDLQQIISDSCTEVDSNSSQFWVMLAALKKIYQAKAEADYLVIEQRVKNILKKIGRDPDGISKTMIKSFCKNARKLKVCRYRLLEDEFSNPSLPQLQKYLTDEDYSVAMGFYILLRAVDRFTANYNSFPGQFDGEMDEDISRLKTTAVGLLSDLGCNGSPLTEDLINEMCRFGASELHAVAAFIGGVASQEVIKLITRQFVPISGTFIFNGIDHKSQLLAL